MLRKLRLNSGLTLALMLILSLASSLITSRQAQAASDYDNVFNITNAVRVSDTTADPGQTAHACSSQNISTSWANILQTESYWSHSVGQSYTTTKNAFQATLANGTGWVVQEREFHVGSGVGNYSWGAGDTATQVTFTADNSNYVDFATIGNRAYAIMHADSAPVYTVIIGQYWNSSTHACSIGVAVSRVQSANSTNQQYVNEEMWAGRDNSDNSLNSSFKQLLVNSPITYPFSYAGQYDASNTDTDSDGLTKAREFAQGTLDITGNEDTDGDGLNDYTESIWNPDRDTAFCGSTECAYPNPTKKDLYVEVDWMQESGISGRSFEPTTSQLSIVKDAYAAHGINAHFDTGQYGGGNQLPSYASNLRFTTDSSGVDFYDYKNGTSVQAANFNSTRQHVWHYMVAGYEWNDGDSNTHFDEGSSGATYISDDDTFVSVGLIEDNPNNDFTYSSVNNAVAGTILHELGHSLCLTGQSSYSLRSECYYQYVDGNSAPSTYNSVMNYSYQMSDLLDYSDGSNSPDHNDWSAIELGFADFTNVNRGDELGYGKGKFVAGINRKQAKQLRKEHRISSHVDKTKRSVKRQTFDMRKVLELHKR